MKQVRIYGLLLLLALLLSACLSAQEADALPATPTSTPLPPPTSTIDWFPRTATATRIPADTPIPTPDQHPGIGDLLLKDQFANEGQWQTASNSVGSIAYGQQELTIAISQPKGILFSLRQAPMLDNFYLEITASPSLCRGMDSYGLLLRAASGYNAYRFVVSCDGHLRLERLKNAEVVLIQDWTPSGQVPLGSPVVIRIGVWAAGNELRFFVNDRYQFSAHDPVWSIGQVGVFARAAGDTALTVSFSDLEVYRLDTLPTPATATPTPFLLNPTLSDPGDG